jgi:CP family cyanate transporter-like MFS transporter
LLGAAVLLVAMNLRPSVASLGPLLDEARLALGASAAWAGLLTTVPVLCFAAAGLVAPAVARRAGPHTTIAVALAMVTTGLVLRVTAGAVLMTVATVIASIGVAAAGVLLPVVVKTSFPARVGLVTGLYTASLQTGAALAFALSAPLARQLGGWRPALASWAVLAVLALGVWLIAGRRQSERRGAVPGEPVSARSLLGNGFAWIITGFFGLQAFVAFAVIGWLAQVIDGRRGQPGLRGRAVEPADDHRAADQPAGPPARGPPAQPERMDRRPRVLRFRRNRRLLDRSLGGTSALGTVARAGHERVLPRADRHRVARAHR